MFFVLAVCAASAGPTAFDAVRGVPYEVGWTPRGLTINGAPQMLLSGDVHCRCNHDTITPTQPQPQLRSRPAPPPPHHVFVSLRITITITT